jgi:transcriptional regulator with XRE-family HTH domain
MTQAELAAQIGSTESTLSRFISGKTDKLGDESIIAIARVFNVSTDFLLGEVDIPDRKNYDISELGLSGAGGQKSVYWESQCRRCRQAFRK